MSNARINWLDTAKSLGILLVVFGHLSSFGWMTIYSFHMPLFFFMAGIVFKSEGSFKNFFIKKLRSLYVPYIAFLIIEYMIYFISHYHTLMFKDYAVMFIKQLLGMGLSSDAYLWNGSIWFLCALFFAEMVFFFISKANNNWVLAATFVLALIGSVYFKYDLPFALKYVFPACMFLSLGLLFRKANCFNIEKCHAWLCVLIAVGCCTVICFTARINGEVGMRGCVYGDNLIVFFLNAFLGICAVIFLSVLFRNINILQFYGKNSIIILCLHLYFTNKLVPLVLNLLSVEENMPGFLLVECISVIVIFALFYPLITLINKYVPFVFGRKFKNVP